MHASAEAVTDEGRSMAVPAALTSEGGVCTIKLDFRGIQNPGAGSLVVQLTLNHEAEKGRHSNSRSNDDPLLCGFEPVELAAAPDRTEPNEQ